MSVSLPSDKLIEIQHLAHSLLPRQPITVHHVMTFLSKSNFWAKGHTQLCQLCHVIQRNMLNVNNSTAHLFLSFHLSLLAWHHLWRLSQLQQCPFP